MLASWKEDDEQSFAHMARPARVLLGTPASASVLERECSAARRTSDESWAEVIGLCLDSLGCKRFTLLFHNGNIDINPHDVHKLETEALHFKIQCCLRQPDPKLALDGEYGGTFESEKLTCYFAGHRLE